MQSGPREASALRATTNAWRAATVQWNVTMCRINTLEAKEHLNKAILVGVRALLPVWRLKPTFGTSARANSVWHLDEMVMRIFM